MAEATVVGGLHKKEALVAILAISAITLMAASYAGLHASRHVGSVELVSVTTPFRIPLVSGEMLSQLSSSSENYQQLALEKKMVGEKLGRDMRKLWSANTRSGKHKELAKVEALRNEFETVLDSLDSAPVLKAIRGPNGELRAEDTQDGRVFEIYPYQGRDQSASLAAPMLYDDQPYNINPVFIDDSYIPRFTNPPEQRNPIYQGVYPEYFVVADSTGQLRLIPKAASPTLFPSSVQSAIATAPQASRRDPAEEEWFAHEGELAKRFRTQLRASRRSGLAASKAAESDETDPADDARQKAPVAASLTDGGDGEAAPSETASSDPAVARRAAVRHSMDSIVGQAWRGDEVISAAAADAPAPAANSAKPALASAAAAAPRRRAASNPLLRESGRHVYGSVYEPRLDPRANPALRAGDEFTDLRGPAKGYFDHYARLSQRVLDVQDPARGRAAGADWWTGPESRDKWWEHSHEGRGY